MPEESAEADRITLDSLSESLRGFYVPQFEMLVEGAGLPDDVMRDVIELTYKDDLDNMDSFQITVSNWDEVARDYKYIGSEDVAGMGAGANGPRSAGSAQSDRYELFEPCSKQVKVRMGYLGDLKTMMTGFFTTMEPSFSPGAPATLNVRGINVLQRLRTKKYNDFFEGMRPSEIARLVGERRDEDLNALRLPIEIVIDEDVLGNERPIAQIAQRNEYSIDFLWKLARREGYVITMLESGEPDGDPRIRFAPSERGQSLGDAVYDLKLRQSLIDFRPRITTANQFKSVTVNSWNRSTQERITETVSFEDEEMQELNADLRYMLCMCDAREELVVDEPQWDENQAKERARALLLDQQKQMVKASGTTLGLPLLRAGTRVRISEVGARLTGDYFVTSTEHVFNDSGYITKFEARRETVPADGETRPCRT
ncbi:phage late control D family protein [Mangrovimicrobium sediminis]|uniref:Phage late control D family protein n=1 Tax=Mangrovimicrobium sediminis TaxID=2562682 RepID=A0A4Z0M9I4_9GAMM|nr:phage late control D family protein [Haliea sp. SAOS-164]TGD76179.1 phage late control D family protein [Haliea sp. SAOS-164]